MLNILFILSRCHLLCSGYSNQGWNCVRTKRKQTIASNQSRFLRLSWFMGNSSVPLGRDKETLLGSLSFKPRFLMFHRACNTPGFTLLLLGYSLLVLILYYRVRHTPLSPSATATYDTTSFNCELPDKYRVWNRFLGQSLRMELRHTTGNNMEIEITGLQKVTTGRHKRWITYFTSENRSKNINAFESF